ncbi:MAG: shikimate kinase AroL [Pseudodesulfovibrio sp.]|uniref:shikimate kinase AroL n=1 Tax=Pseudodesulfovibrio sp. TaxID=2035812 RepID=UPI003D0B9D24
MHKTGNIFLIGPRACGKTSVGRALAKRLGVEFVDTDHAFVEAVGMDIASFVEANGWEAFRDEEAATLAREAAPGGRVIGCGGGIVLREENRAVLARGIVIYLKAGAEELARRLMADPLAAQRPSLTGKSVADEVREVLAARAHLYEGCADRVIEGQDLDGTVELALGVVKTFPERF